MTILFFTGVQPGQPAVCPSAPDLGQMEKIPGYEGIGFEDGLYDFHKFQNFYFIIF